MMLINWILLINIHLKELVVRFTLEVLEPISKRLSASTLPYPNSTSLINTTI
jgi:hypothetical protein